MRTASTGALPSPSSALVQQLWKYSHGSQSWPSGLQFNIAPADRWKRSPRRAYTLGMKRLIFIVMALLLLAGIGIVAWTVAGLPPVRMVWRYGFYYHPEPTGQVKPIGGIDFVEIGPGCFLMGSREGAEGGDLLGQWCARFGLPWGDQPKPSDEMPVHWVEFPRGYFIARTEVTNAQYEAFRPKHERSEYSRGDNDPVVDVSWEDAKESAEAADPRAGC